MSAENQWIDQNAIRFNQALIIGFLMIAYIFNNPVPVGFVMAIMLIGTLLDIPGFQPLYKLLHRLKVIDTDVSKDHREPHRFAQGVGALVLAFATLSFSLKLSILGWLLSWTVIALAALNLFGGFCVGCAFYYWFQRLGVPGFHHAPPDGASPGRRPPK